jgi:paraquat-inducible protein A
MQNATARTHVLHCAEDGETRALLQPAVALLKTGILAFFMQASRYMKALLACKTCGLVQHLEHLPRGYKAECARCGEVLLCDHTYSRALTAAFSLAALFLYVPANIYPVMMMHYLGRETENTVWGGVQALWSDGMWGVAIIVFLASLLIPLLKLLGLFFLVSVRTPRWQRLRTRIFKIIEKIGPWAMLDVFLLAIMVAVIRFGKFATVVPGPGIVAFTAVVVLTLLASGSFEPQLIWKGENFERDAKTAA